MNRRTLLARLGAAALAVLAAPLLPALGSPAAPRVFQSGVFSLGPAPAKPWRYLRVGLDLASDKTVTSVVMGADDQNGPWHVIEEPRVVVHVRPESVVVTYDEYGNEQESW